MTDELRQLEPTRAPRLMVAFVYFNAVVWLVAVLAILAIRIGRPDALILSLYGAIIAPLTIAAVYFARILLYIVYRFYWYVTGCLSLFAAVAGLCFLPYSASQMPNLTVIGTAPNHDLLTIAAMIAFAGALNIGVIIVLLSGLNRRARKPAHIPVGAHRDAPVHSTASDYPKPRAPRPLLRDDSPQN